MLYQRYPCVDILLQKFEKFIKDQRLIQKDTKLLLAVSGGMDSLCLADLCHRSELNFSIAHCNFQLRGKASDEDAQWVEQLAKQWEVPFFLKHFDTQAEALDRRLSIQMLARDLRYEWFEQLRHVHGFEAIATAHHLNDRIESILINLCRGTGYEGLLGIPLRNGHIIRPLLFAQQEEIQVYVEERKLSWREDASNAEDYYQRNFLRHRVIPLLKELNPDLENTWQRNLERWEGAKGWLDRHLRAFFDRELQLHPHLGEEALPIAALEQEGRPEWLLYEWLKGKGFSYAQCTELSKALSGQPGKSWEAGGYWLVKDRELLILKKQEKATPSFPIRVEKAGLEIVLELGNLRIQGGKGIPPDIKQAKGLWLDEDKITYPLALRPWQPGDSFYPFGMKGRKKVSDYLIDEKIPLHRKSQCYVLVSGEEIVCLVGMRMDRRFQLDAHSQQALHISLTENDQSI